MSSELISKPPLHAKILIIVAICIDVITGAIHLFAPDGGAQTIANFDLIPGQEATDQIIYLFALLGSVQICFAIFYGYILLKKTDMVTFGVFTIVFLNGMGIILNFFYKALPHFYPNKLRTVVMFLWGTVTLILILRRKKSI
jgi:hypothetical protein